MAQRSYGKKPERKEFLELAPKMADTRLRLGEPQVWQPGQTLNQGDVGACIGFSGTDDINSTPFPHAFDNKYALDLYWWIKANVDHEPNVDDGSTHESLIVALKQRGFLGTYSISANAAIAQAYVDNQSPVILGTLFYYSMESPDKDGVVAVDPSSGIAGGHSYTWIANTSFNGAPHAVIQNSWDFTWGIPFRGISGGFALVPMTGVYHLLGLPGSDAGDVLAFTELGTAPNPPPPQPPPQPSGCLTALAGYFHQAELDSKISDNKKMVKALQAAEKVLLSK